MTLARLYVRVLQALGPEARVAWALGLGNLALAIAQFAEPVLFGRIIDTRFTALARAQFMVADAAPHAFTAVSRTKT